MTQRVSIALATLLLSLATVPAQAANASRNSSFVYDPASGLLTKEIIEPNNSQLCLVTEYTYDTFGNKTSVTTRNCNGAAGEAAAPTSDAVIASRTTSSAYDTKGQFAVSTTNALNHTETRTFDPKFGGVLTLTGPNGLTTAWTYDSFGRKTQETRADGTTTGWSYVLRNLTNWNNHPNLAYHIATTESGVAQPSYTYYDILNRKIVSSRYNFTNTDLIDEGSTFFDNYGRVYKTYLPYERGQSASAKYATYTYDILGRVLTETAPNNGVTTTTYAGLTTTVTNAQSQTKTTVKNTQGQTVTITDAQNKTIGYAYDPFGNLTQTTDTLGNVTTLSYDARGRKTGMNDPDMGVWSYAYNALGELIRQVDAKNQTVTMAYDKLGRMTSRTEPDLTSTWVFDTATKGIGKLASASSSNGYSRTHSYDSLGRLSSTSTVIDAAPYVTSTTYDAYGRTDTQTYPASAGYPTGFAVRNVYNSNSYLIQVVNAATPATVYWTANSMDAQGHLTQQTYGNGVVTQQVFDPATGKLLNQYAGAGNAVQNMSYTYDTIGNLSTRQDANQNLVETYLYDTLNRLTSATAVSGAVNVTTTFAYNAIGNITSKSDVGAYTYNASGGSSIRPHAVAGITGTVNGVVNPAYTYDANGNMTDGAGRTTVWTSFNMPGQITSQTPNGAKTAQFWYNPEHERTKELQADQSIVIVLSPRYDTGLHFEKKYIAAGGSLTGAIEYEHYLYAGGLMFGKYVTITQTDGQTIATTRTDYYSKDHLGSIVAITDQTGAVTQRLSYDAWGKKRYPNGAADPNGLLNNPDMYHGYTGHEHMDELGIIHMNGRLYDPFTARFLSADPHIQDPLNLQSYNRYSYCWGNPMGCTDPSGYFSLGSFIRTAAAIAVAVYAPQFIAGATGWGAAASQIAAGALSGAISSGNMQGAVTGGLSAGMFGGLHGWEPSGFFDSAMKVAAHGSVGGIASALQGGDFKSGFMSAAFTQAASLGGAFGGIQSRVGNAVAAAIVGGTASVLGGGKFENGAVTGAFSRLFNDLKFEGVAKTDQKGRIYVEGTATLTDPETGEVLISGPAISGPYVDKTLPKDVKGGPLPVGDYVGKNFRVRYETAMTVTDSQGKVGWSVDLSDKGGRTELRIHPDGNVRGTSGCVAPQTQARDWGNNLRDQINKYGSIPVKVSY